MRFESDQWIFFSEFLRNPLRIAAVQPSSRAFVEDLLADIQFEDDAVYVEYGAGTGAVSKEICDRMSQGSVCIAVEPNHAFNDHIIRQSNRLKVIQDVAENATEKILEFYGAADIIFAGLPFSLMPEENIYSVLREAKILLRADGELRLFFYAHSLLIPKIQRMIDSTMDGFRLSWTSVSWKNVPPMAIVKCVN